MSWVCGKKCTVIWSEDKYVLGFPLKGSGIPEFICCSSYSLPVTVWWTDGKGLPLQIEDLHWEIFVHSDAEHFWGSKTLLGWGGRVMICEWMISWSSLNQKHSNLFLREINSLPLKEHWESDVFSLLFNVLLDGPRRLVLGDSRVVIQRQNKHWALQWHGLSLVSRKFFLSTSRAVSWPSDQGLAQEKDKNTCK